jgi:serine/threonine protein kinase/Tfp pilus assembly protein PilF
MNAVQHELERGSVDAGDVVRESQLRSQLLSETRQRLAAGDVFDAQAFLAEHPELWSCRSLVLDLVYEEFCQQLERDRAVDREGFCQRFPGLERSLRRLLAVHDYLEANSHLVTPLRVSWPELGQTRAGFAILAELGRGSFARVYLAEEMALGHRRVALKLSTEGAAEAEILGKLEHPGIVPVYSMHREDDGRLTMICMPYLGRVTLLNLLDELYAGKGRPQRSREIVQTLAKYDDSPPPGGSRRFAGGALRRGAFVDGAAHLGCQLAEALAYAHSQGVCHSDLKPSNVLISPGGQPMLLDFNLAFEVKAAQRRLGGTLPYMAPEQIQAMVASAERAARAVGQPADVFALGVILYELLAGQLPFGPLPTDCSSEQAKLILLRRQEAGARPLREVNADVDSELAGIVASCLAFAPQDRPSAAALAAALGRSVSSAGRARRWARRHRWLVGLSTALLIALAIAVGLFCATREPYLVRQLHRGLAHYRQAEYPQAEAYFTRVVDVDKENAAAWFWRARARQKQGQSLLAVDDYTRAARLSPAGEIYACQAYCYATERMNNEAIYAAERAIRAGFESAELYNILGYCYAGQSRFPSALSALDEALRLDPGLQRALHNRAMAEINWSTSNIRHQFDPRALADIERALQIGTPDGRLYLDAARVYALIPRNPQPDRERIQRYLCEALRLGAEPAVVRREFATLFDRTTLEALLAEARSAGSRASLPRIVDPLPDDAFAPR